MASHERCRIELEITPARRRFITHLRRRWFRRTSPRDADIANFILELAFIIPERIEHAVECFVNYRDAEDLAGAAAVAHLTAARNPTRRKAKS